MRERQEEEENKKNKIETVVKMTHKINSRFSWNVESEKKNTERQNEITDTKMPPHSGTQAHRHVHTRKEWFLFHTFIYLNR